jgi:zinc/manganese transport system substrate-binding protein
VEIAMLYPASNFLSNRLRGWLALCDSFGCGAGRRHSPDRGRGRLSWAVFGGLAGVAMAVSAAQATPIEIVAAENFYGDIAGQIGGDAVAVTSILTNPDRDPHEFEANATTARAIAGAAIVVYNGADYDPWVVKLLSASPSPSRKIIVVAELVGNKAGDNPHLWYEPSTMPAFAKALAATLTRFDPGRASDFAHRLALFRASLRPLDARIVALRRKYAGTPVTATEPVFGYMADALGLAMRNRGFQLAVMNGTEPGASAIAAFQRDLGFRAVKVLFYNAQTTDALTARMRRIAQEAGIPVVGVMETEPPGKDYQEWMLSQLDALDRALSR